MYVLEKKKIRKLGIPLQTPFISFKNGVYGEIHVHFMDMFS